MVTKEVNSKPKSKVSVCSREYIYWVKNMLKKKTRDSTGFSNLDCPKKANKRVRKKDIENYKNLVTFFEVVEKYAQKGYITRYYKEGFSFLDIRYYIYFEGIIFVLQKKLVQGLQNIRIYEATDIDITSSWRDVIIFNDLACNIYSDEIKYRINVFEKILNNENMVRKIKSESLYESKKYLLQKINEDGEYKVPVKSILQFLIHVKYEM